MSAKKAVTAGRSKTSRAVKVERFIEAYLSNGQNATRAAITAGYAKRSAKQTGSRMLTYVDVKQLLAARQKALIIVCELSTERTLREVARIAYFRPRDILAKDGMVKPLAEWSDDALACIVPTKIDFVRDKKGKVTGQSVEIKAWDKNAALEKAMKFHGLFEQDNKQRPRGADLRVRFVDSPNLPKPGARAK